MASTLPMLLMASRRIVGTITKKNPPRITIGTQKSLDS